MNNLNKFLAHFLVVFSFLGLFFTSATATYADRPHFVTANRKLGFINMVKNNLFKEDGATIIRGQITIINGTILTVVKGQKNYTVQTDSNTKFERHYWGKSSFSELSLGNIINILGKFTDESKTTILAKFIRDLSIMKRNGVFLGEVKIKNNDNFVISTKNRGDQTIYFSSSTKFTDKKESAISYSDIQVGHKIRVKGIWDKSVNKVTEVTSVKDFSLPPKPTNTPTPTP